MKNKNTSYYLIIIAIIISVIYLSFFLVDLGRLIYYHAKMNDFEVTLIKEYERTLNTKKVDEKIIKEYKYLKVDKNEQNSFVEYTYTLKVKVYTPPFNFVFKDGYEIKDAVLINK